MNPNDPNLEQSKELSQASDNQILNIDETPAQPDVLPQPDAEDLKHGLENQQKAEETLNETAMTMDAEVNQVEEQIANQVKEYSTLEEVVDAAKKIAEKPAAEIERIEVSRLRQQFMNIQKAENDKALEAFVAEGNKAEDFNAPELPAEEAFKEVMNEIKEKKAEYINQQNENRQANLAQKLEIINKIISLAEDTDNVNKTFNEYRELQDKFNAIGEVPPTEETSIWKQFQDARERYSDNLKINKELRDYDFKKNLEQKEDIVTEANSLTSSEDVLGSFKRLQELHNRWREIGPVAKELRDDIWNRFKEASTEINKRYQAHFEERKNRELENERAKTALCERIEALDFASLNSFAAWDEMTKKIIEAQEEWRKLGFASKKMNNALFNRFRATCDTFFALKGAYYKNIKDELAENLAKKTALVEKAEALKDSTDWKKTTDTLVELQKEWKTIGTVAKKHSDAIWKRFQTACDTFFENKKKLTSSTRLTEHANLQAKRDLIKELDTITEETPKADAIALINDLRDRWKSIGHVPFREKDRVYDAFRAKIDEVREKFDLRETRDRQARFETNLAALEGDGNKISRERDRLLRVLETRRAELRTYENNLGFLSAKSKSGNTLVRDFEKKIERLRDDITTLEGQIRQLDAKL